MQAHLIFCLVLLSLFLSFSFLPAGHFCGWPVPVPVQGEVSLWPSGSTCGGTSVSAELGPEPEKAWLICDRELTWLELWPLG